MLRVDVALKVVSCDMYVAKYILHDVARKIDSFNIPRKIDAVLRRKSLLQVVPCNTAFMLASGAPNGSFRGISVRKA